MPKTKPIQGQQLALDGMLPNAAKTDHKPVKKPVKKPFKKEALYKSKKSLVN